MLPKHSKNSATWHIRISNLGEMESHGNLLFNSVTIATVSEVKRAPSSVGIIAARLRVLRTLFRMEEARSYSSKWAGDSLRFRAAHTTSLLSPIV